MTGHTVKSQSLPGVLSLDKQTKHPHGSLAQVGVRWDGVGVQVVFLYRCEVRVSIFVCGCEGEQVGGVSGCLSNLQ